jgi:hypothetical protein
MKKSFTSETHTFAIEPEQNSFGVHIIGTAQITTTTYPHTGSWDSPEDNPDVDINTNISEILDEDGVPTELKSAEDREVLREVVQLMVEDAYATSALAHTFFIQGTHEDLNKKL